MNTQTQEEFRSAVRKHYGELAAEPAKTEAQGCCGPECCAPETAPVVEVNVAGTCCGSTTAGISPEAISAQLGYSAEEISRAPEGANLGLGCGNPIAIASLKAGERVLDLGSGGGFDCFLASANVGPTGHVIGIDMTPDMISRARTNADRGKFTNVEFRLGEIEHLPVADNSIDVLISNCVINLSPEKEQVFRDAYRVLAPGGRVAISDIVATAPLPDAMRSDPRLYCSCIGGASSVEEMRAGLAAAGFRNIRIDVKEESRAFIHDWVPGLNIEQYIASAVIEAEK